MAQTVVWSANLGTTTRKRVSDGATYGQGQAKRWYVGRYKDGSHTYDYDTFVRFALNWSGVGKIVRAVLNIYTDDGLGDMPATTTEHPRTVVRRLTGAFVEGNAPDGEWQSNDYTAPAYTTSDGVAINLTRESLGLTQVDITAIVEDWAPKTVKTRTGAAGGAVSNYGLALHGFTDSSQNVGLASDKFADTNFRPTITLTYEYGPTVPNAPTSLAPSGTVLAFEDFQGDFSDIRPTDTLAKSHVQVYDAEHTFSTIGASDTVSHTNHGLINGDVIYFTRLVGGTGLVGFHKYFVVQKTLNTFKVSQTLGGTPVDITVQYTDGGWAKLLYDGQLPASRTEVEADHFVHLPVALDLNPNTSYRWRARVIDNEGQVSAFSALVTFQFTNTAPHAPVLDPVSASSYATPDGVDFSGTFVDDDAGDTLLAYEVQMSAYPQGDSHWDDDAFILWNTGKVYIAPGPTSFSTPYGGGDLAAGTYYWRARVYDNKNSASAYTYASIVFTDSFEADPTEATTAIQLRPKAPWRIVIRDMYQSDGVTRTTGRGPGRVAAVITDAKNVGASELYNSPGEIHFTLPKDHPQISAIEPRQTHYSLQFRHGDGWYEKFAGLMTDFDATDTDIVFYGVDYLGLYDFMIDERYDPSNPEKAADKGGSKYVTKSLSYVIGNAKYGQLALAKNLTNSPVGFITIGSIGTMTETVTVYSTYSPVLQFVVGLLDSHRAGTGHRTRLRVRRTSAGGYEVIVQENPGQVRDNLRMRYGELVQGYRVVAFGKDWATRVAGIGRAKDGIKVMYEQRLGAGISETTWGRWTNVQLFDGVSDPADLKRRLQQAATNAARIGRQVGVGLRSLILQPKDGYDITDHFPIDIVDGPIDTAAFGSGYWTCVGVTWTCNAQDGKQETILSFQPREDSVAPDSDLLDSEGNISGTKEWQIGWTSPNPLTVTSHFWLDQSTGTVYERTDGALVAEGITGTA